MSSHPERKMRKTLEERFWEKIDRRGPDECWLWTASTTRGGYGQLAEGAPSRRMLKAHRVSYEIVSGPIPRGEGHHGICVCPTCDNPPCCNPGHLFLGTIQEDTADKVEKGRQAKHEQNGNSKLTEEQVAESRRDYVWHSRTHGQPALARKYGVTQSTIGVIIKRKYWK